MDPDGHRRFGSRTTLYEPVTVHKNFGTMIHLNAHACLHQNTSMDNRVDRDLGQNAGCPGGPMLLFDSISAYARVSNHVRGEYEVIRTRPTLFRSQYVDSRRGKPGYFPKYAGMNGPWISHLKARMKARYIVASDNDRLLNAADASGPRWPCLQGWVKLGNAS